MSIYFIQDEELLIKIGYTNNFSQRFADLKRQTRSSLRVLKVIKGGIKQEKQLHYRFRRLNVRDEWFRPEGELLEFIDSLTHLPRECKPKTELLTCTVNAGDKQIITKAAEEIGLFVLGGAGAGYIGSMGRLLRAFVTALRSPDRDQLLQILSTHSNKDGF